MLPGSPSCSSCLSKVFVPRGWHCGFQKMIVMGHRVLGERAGLGRAGMNEEPLTPGQLTKSKQPVMSQLSSHKTQVLVKPEMNGNYENYPNTREDYL